MLPIKESLQIDMYAQDLIDRSELLSFFKSFDTEMKKNYMEEIISLINQSRPQEADINAAIQESGLKPTYTSCVMLKKGIAPHLLRKFTELPINETEKTFILLLSLFKVAYLRRFENEKDDPNKWWYWDLSKKENITYILNKIDTNANQY